MDMMAMTSSQFAEWAETAFGADYDDVVFADMLDPSGLALAEMDPTEAAFPEELAALLAARRTARMPQSIARHTARAQAYAEAYTLVRQPEPWNRQVWQRLVTLGYAFSTCEDGGEQGSLSWTYSLTINSMRLLDPSYDPPGRYDDQGGIDG